MKVNSHKIFIVSCLHLSNKQSEEGDQKLIQLIDQIGKNDLLVLDGDTFELIANQLWFVNNLNPLSNSEQVEKNATAITNQIFAAHKKLFAKLHTLGQRLVIVLGNHDELLKRYTNLKEKIRVRLGNCKIENSNYKDKKVYVEHGDREDETPPEVMAAVALEINAGFLYRLRKSIAESSVEPESIMKLNELIQNIDKVYPRIYLANYIENIGKELPVNAQSILFKAWNDTWKIFLARKEVIKFLQNKPLKKFILEYGNQLGSLSGRLIRFAGNILFRLHILKLDPGSAVADSVAAKLESEFPQEIIVFGHFHSSEKTQKNRKTIIRIGTWIRPIQISNVPNHQLKSYPYVLIKEYSSGLTSAYLLQA